MSESTSHASRIEALFHRALQVPAAERESFLQTECHEDEAALAEVRGLLEADSNAGAAWDQTAFDAITRAPETLGPYRILDVISSGGMGTVYRAVRADDEFEQQVAIKLIRAGMDSQAIIRRFRQERQILASLEHPNIARLLDGGTTPSGVPYLVMEFIEGQPVTAYADSLRLATVDRLRLFLQICAAVEHAHQKLVVHRDLKPGNILVTPAGVPKLLDFGIAKLIGREQGFDQTATAAQFFTPEYASPEQIRQEPVGTSTDIYSLGALLYRLLTGQGAYGLKTPRPDELAQAICTQEPERPSEIVSRLGLNTGEGSSARLRRKLHGDLDNIVLMALRKDPSRRYASVGQFAEDIARYLDGRPVVAHADSFGYRLRKFVGRNLLPVAAGAALILTLVAGIVTTLWQARAAGQQRERAERRVQDLRKLSTFLLSEITDKLEQVPGTLQVRRAIVQRSTEYLDTLARDASDDRALQAEIAVGYYQVARLTFNVEGALAELHKAVAIGEELQKAEPGNTAYVVLLAQIYGETANQLKLRGDMPAAIAIQAKALPIFDSLETMAPNVRAEQANAIMSMGRFYSDSGQDRLGLEANDRAIAIIDAAHKANPQDQDFRDLLSVAYNYRVRSLFEIGDYHQALDYTKRDCAAIDRDLAEHPDYSVFQRRKWVCHSWLGRTLDKVGQTAAGIEEVKKGLALIEALSAKDPSDSGHARGVSITYLLLAQLYRTQGAREAAEAALAKAIAINASLMILDPKKAETLWDQASMMREQGIEQRLIQRHEASAASLERSLVLFDGLVAQDPRNGKLLANQADAYADRALTAEAAGQQAEAIAAWTHARNILTGLRDRKLLREVDVPKLGLAIHKTRGIAAVE